MVRDHFVTVRRLKFHYREWSRRGTPLILLHGLSSQSHIFDAVAPALSPHFRVIALDQRGHGESSKPNDGYDYKTVSADLRTFLDALRIKRAIIAGHSWGGGVALYFAAHYPERTSAIVLIDGGFTDMQANPKMTWKFTKKELAPMRLQGMTVEKFKALLKEYVGKRWNRVAEAAILANFEITPDQTIHRRLSHENHLKILRALWEQRPGTLYPLVKCPVLILPAIMESEDKPDRSANRRVQVQAAAGGLQKVQVVWFKNTSHDIPIHRPKKLATVIIRFARDENLIRRA